MSLAVLFPGLDLSAAAVGHPLENAAAPAGLRPAPAAGLTGPGPSPDQSPGPISGPNSGIRPGHGASYAGSGTRLPGRGSLRRKSMWDIDRFGL